MITSPPIPLANTTRNAAAPFALILSLILAFGPVSANAPAALAAGCSGGAQAVTGESVQLCGTTVVHADETSALRISLTPDVQISAADLGSESQIEIVGDGTAPAVMVTKTDSGEGMFHAVAFPDGYSDSDSRAGLIEPMEGAVRLEGRDISGRTPAARPDSSAGRPRPGTAGASRAAPMAL